MECYKQCFSLKEAKTALNEIKRHRGRKYRREVRIYECNKHKKPCWHLTSQEEYSEKEEIKIDELKYKEKWKKLMDI